MKKNSASKRIWNFLWHDDSYWSWLANILIAFILIRFIFYPLLGVIFGTGFPIVAVLSESMEHGTHNYQICSQSYPDFKDSFDNYWNECGDWYEKRGIWKSQFQEFPFGGGFNKGDMIFVWGSKPKNINLGDVVIFKGSRTQPIIHRVVDKWIEEEDYYFQTKGDHNSASITGYKGETKIHEDRILGKSVLRIPYLGWVKLLFVQAVKPFGIEITR